MRVVEGPRHQRVRHGGVGAGFASEDPRTEDVEQPEQEPGADHARETEGVRVAGEEPVASVGFRVLVRDPAQAEERLRQTRVLVVVVPTAVDRLGRERGVGVVPELPHPAGVILRGGDVAALVA